MPTTFSARFGETVTRPRWRFTIRFNRTFSRSNSFNRFTSSAVIAPYCTRQRWKVCSDTSNGAPEHIRCDNGPELTANALRDWCRFNQAGSAYIEPGSPWQNAYVESFGSRVRDELLGVELFQTLAEAQLLVEDWRLDYNTNRPHSALGGLTPVEYAATGRENHRYQSDHA